MRKKRKGGPKQDWTGQMVSPAAGQIYNGDIGNRNTEDDAFELSIQLRCDLTYPLSISIPSQLSRGAIYLLGSSKGMNCSHETFHNARVVMNDLGEGGPRGQCRRHY